MQIAILIWLCCFVVKTALSLETINSENVVRHTFSDDKLLIKGNFVNISDIKALVNNRTIQKVYVYVVNTFYVDDNLELRGIKELQIFANTWNISREVTFDLSGLDGEYQAPLTVKGSGGNPGKAGMSGGNFFGLAIEIINAYFLTVDLHGGNGSDGQDGTASDDVQVTFNGTDSRDRAEFTTADLHAYYKHYFEEKGYDPDIRRINDTTSLYALFLHNKKANLEIRLHPGKCCGTTGVGGVGGLGGRSGTYTFMKIGDASDSPKFGTEEGSIGKSGKDATACTSTALDIRVASKLENGIFISIPLSHSFSSEFFIGDHINSSKCTVQFVKGGEEIPESVLESERHKSETVSAIIEYKLFLLEQMKNRSLGGVIQRTIQAIDSNLAINNAYTLIDFVDEANAWEVRYFELRKYVDFQKMYKSLYERVPKPERRTYNYYSSASDDSSDDPVSLLNSILSKKERHLEESLITDIDIYFEVAIFDIERRNGSVGQNLNIKDESLRRNINQLQFNANANYILKTYYDVYDGYKLTFFPFAAQFLEPYELSTSLTSYEDLNELKKVTTSKLKSMNETISKVNSKSIKVGMLRLSTESSNPEKYFYKWNNSEIRDDLRRLFKGEKIQLFADVKQSKKDFNAFQFNAVDLVFHSSNKHVNDHLNDVLEDFAVWLHHKGRSGFRCNDKFYEIDTDTVSIYFGFSKDSSQERRTENLVNINLRESRPLLSPYTVWEIQLEHLQRGNRFHQLESLHHLPDIQLHCSGKYITEDASICEDSNLDKIYSRI